MTAIAVFKEKAMTDKRKNNTQDPNAYANALVKPAKAPSAAEALTQGFGGVVSAVSPEEMNELAAQYDVTATLVELAQGQKIQGILLGAGPILTQNGKEIDPETGKMEESRPINTWQLQIGDVRVCIFASHQLGNPHSPENEAIIAWVKNGRQGPRPVDSEGNEIQPKGDLPLMVGKQVLIIRGADVNVGKRRVTKYITGVLKDSALQ
jgi:hypothetical protein